MIRTFRPLRPLELTSDENQDTVDHDGLVPGLERVVRRGDQGSGGDDADEGRDERDDVQLAGGRLTVLLDPPHEEEEEEEAGSQRGDDLQQELRVRLEAARLDVSEREDDDDHHDSDRTDVDGVERTTEEGHGPTFP